MTKGVRLLRLAALALSLAAPVAAAEPDSAASSAADVPEPPERHYGLDYRAKFLPAEGVVQMSVKVRQSTALVRSVEFRFDPERYSNFEADGGLEVSGETVQWNPPPRGGALRYSLRLDHRRGQGGFDSRMANNWAVFRGDDLLPPAAMPQRRMPSFLMIVVWAAPPTRETERPALMAGRIPALNRSVSR